MCLQARQGGLPGGDERINIFAPGSLAEVENKQPGRGLVSGTALQRTSNWRVGVGGGGRGGSFPAFVTVVTVYRATEGVCLGSDVRRSATMAQRGARQHPPACLRPSRTPLSRRMQMHHFFCRGSLFFFLFFFFYPAKAAQKRSYADSGVTFIPDAPLLCSRPEEGWREGVGGWGGERDRERGGGGATTLKTKAEILTSNPPNSFTETLILRALFESKWTRK